ncbi:S9 family peptidase [Ideonella sp. 4Y11]|uniref:S9 family peptidase n=1 Tax=Ideonella aquatica TaxID=2824119 RepID=A0A941BR35_9BURK|nr:prolyl oligopeptidase family serine peptidase [Ideonella aquatica]MBQ0959880.1 S9 family peptidase [Ideonella aquatica]
MQQPWVCGRGWRSGLVTIVLAGVAWLPGRAAAASDLPVERFFQRPAIEQLKLSPSGRQLAFTTSVKRERVGLVVMNLEGDRQLRWVAAFEDGDVGRFQWVNDERLVFSAIDYQEGSGEDYEYAPGLYSVKSDGTEYRQLVYRRYTPVAIDTRIRDNTLAWNHLLLQVLPGQRNEVIVGQMLFGVGQLAGVEPMWLDTATGRTRKIDLKGTPRHAKQWWFDPQGVPRAIVAERDHRATILWNGADGWSTLAEAAPDKLPFIPEAVDGRGELYLTHRYGAGQWYALGRYDFAAGRPAATNLVEAPGFDVSPDLVFDSTGQRLLGVHLETDAHTTVWYDPALRALQARIDALLPDWSNRLSCARCDRDDRVVLVHSRSASDPGRVWLWRPDQEGRNALQLLQVARPELPVAQMADKGFERIRTRDGREMPLWVTRPVGVPAKARPPAVLLVHGGPWVRGGHWAWDPMVQFLASRGYVVIEPEFRGSAGYGLVHERAGDRQWGRAMQDDLADALRHVQSKGIAGERACIMGASYGGYATLMGLVSQPELWSCGIQWVGVADMELLLKGSWLVRDDISSQGRSVNLPKRVASLPEDAAMVEAIDPVRQAARIKAPLLMAYGTEDQRVPIAHGERMRDALRRAGREPEWVVYPGEGHGWRTEKNQIDFARRVEAFLAKHLPAEGR